MDSRTRKLVPISEAARQISRSVECIIVWIRLGDVHCEFVKNNQKGPSLVRHVELDEIIEYDKKRRSGVRRCSKCKQFGHNQNTCGIHAPERSNKRYYKSQTIKRPDIVKKRKEYLVAWRRENK